MEFQTNFWFSIYIKTLKIDLRFNIQSQIKNWNLICIFLLLTLNSNTRIEFWIMNNFQVLKFNHKKSVESSNTIDQSPLIELEVYNIKGKMIFNFRNFVLEVSLLKLFWHIANVNQGYYRKIFVIRNIKVLKKGLNSSHSSLQHEISFIVFAHVSSLFLRRNNKILTTKIAIQQKILSKLVKSNISMQNPSKVIFNFFKVWTFWMWRKASCARFLA